MATKRMAKTKDEMDLWCAARDGDAKKLTSLLDKGVYIDVYVRIFRLTWIFSSLLMILMMKLLAFYKDDVVKEKPQE